MMKYVAVSLAALMLASVGERAKDADFTGCTTDKKGATLTLALVDSVSATIVKDIQKAFSNAARQMSAEELVSPAGYQLFKFGLSDEDKQAVEYVYGPPVISNDCK